MWGVSLPSFTSPFSANSSLFSPHLLCLVVPRVIVLFVIVHCKSSTVAKLAFTGFRGCDLWTCSDCKGLLSWALQENSWWLKCVATDESVWKIHTGLKTLVYCKVQRFQLCVEHNQCFVYCCTSGWTTTCMLHFNTAAMIGKFMGKENDKNKKRQNKKKLEALLIENPASD